MARTTVTLHEDVEEKIRNRMHQTGMSFKEALNDLVRRGADQAPQVQIPFVVKAHPGGLKPGYSYDNIEELLDQLDGPDRLR